MRRYRRLLYILYKDHATNVKVRRKIQPASDDFDKLMTLVKKRKLRWFIHVSMSSGLAKTILQGTLKDKRRGIQKRRWGDNLKVEEAWTLASSIKHLMILNFIFPHIMNTVRLMWKEHISI